MVTKSEDTVHRTYNRYMWRANIFVAFLIILGGCGAQSPAPSSGANPHDGSIYDVRFAPDGESYASAGLDGKLILWDASDPRSPRVEGVQDAVSGDFGFLKKIAFSSDGSRVAAIRTKDNVSSIVVYACKPFALEATILLPDHAERGLPFFSENGSQLLLVLPNQPVIAWDLSQESSTPPKVPVTAEEIRKLGTVAIRGDTDFFVIDPAEEESVLYAAFHIADREATRGAMANGVAFQDANGGIKYLDFNSKSDMWMELQGGRDKRVTALAVSEQGAIAAGYEDGVLVLWADKSEPPTRTIPGNSQVSALDFSPNGERLVVGRFDYSVTVLSVPN